MLAFRRQVATGAISATTSATVSATAVTIAFGGQAANVAIGTTASTIGY